jgi:hypothetical protein
MWKKEIDVGAQRVPETMTMYREAVDEFSKNATEFLEHIPLLTKARDAFQRAFSAELRNILDTGDETLQTLMAQLEQAVNSQLGTPASDKKKPEAVRVEAINARRENPEATRVLP